MAKNLLSQVNAKYIDRPDLLETYVDSVGMCTMYNNVYRMEFTATLLDEVPKDHKGPPRGRKYPAVRMAMSIPTLVDLYNNLNNVMGILAQQGQISREQTGDVTIQ